MTVWPEVKACSPHQENKEIEDDDIRKTLPSDVRSAKQQRSGRAKRLKVSPNCVMHAQIISHGTRSKTFLFAWRVGNAS